MHDLDPRRVLARPMHDGRTIARVASELLGQWQTDHPGKKLRLPWVVMSRLDAALDETRVRLGSQALRRGNTIK